MGVGTALTIGSVLAKLGQGYFAGRDARNDQREQDRRVGYSNLINTLGGRSTPSPVQPNPGKGATILGGLGTALGAGANITNMIDAKKLADLQKLNLEDQMASRTQSDAITLGTTLGAGSTLPGDVAPPDLSAAGRAAFNISQGEQAAARRAAELAEKQATAAGELNAARVNQMLAQTGKLEREATRLAQPGWTFEESIERAAPTVTSLAQTNTPWAKIAGSPSLSQVHPEALDALRATYDAEAAKVMGERHKGVSDFLYGDVRQLAGQNAMLKKSADLQFGANLLVTGHGQDNGAGDLQMVTASVRLGDPGMGVRPAEAAQWEESGGMVQGWLVFGEKFKEGDRFTPEVRNKLLKAGLDQYEGQIGLVDQAVGNLQSTAAPRILQLMGSEDINTVPGVNEFFDNYRLPPLESYENLTPETLKNYRSMGVVVPFQPSGTGEGTGSPAQVLDFLKRYKPERTAPGEGVLREEWHKPEYPNPFEPQWMAPGQGVLFGKYR